MQAEGTVMAASSEQLQLDLDLALARKRKAESEKMGAFTRFSAGTSRGVAGVVGAPVDIVNGLLSLAGGGHEAPLGGSRNIMQMFEKLGLGAPETAELGRAGKVGEFIGMAAATGPALVGGGIKSLASQAGQVTRTPAVTTVLMQDMARTAVRNPVSFTAYEAIAATGAALAGYEASQRFPDSPAIQAFAEIGGGLSPAAIGVSARLSARAAEKLPLTGIAIRTIRDAYTAVSTPAQTRRSVERVARATPSTLESAAKLSRTDILPDSGLTPAARAGDPGLLELEKSIMESDEALSFQRRQNLTDVNTKIRDSLVAAPKGDVPTHQVKTYFESLLDVRMQQAANIADERLANLGTNATREDLNLFAREELLKAKTAARAQERQLYDAIPTDAAVPTEAAQETLETFRLSVPKAQRGDIPEEALKFLAPEIRNKNGNLVPNQNFLGSETTVNEIRGLQSKLRETARVSRAAGQFNKARISDDIADSLSDDIGNASGSPEVKEAVDVAVAFSRALNDKFTRGAVGRLLGSERSGGMLVAPELTLESVLTKRGPRAAVETEALLKAVRDSGDEGQMRQYIQEFLIDDLRRHAVKEGRLSLPATQRWLDGNRDVLAKFPDLAKDIRTAQTAGGRLVEAERLTDPRVSRAAVFIKAPPGAEIERVIRTAEPRKAMLELLTMARTDPTGKAEAGLKAAFYEHLLGKAQVRNSLDLNDKPFISGRLMTEEISRDPVIEAARGLLSKGEMERLNKIRQTALLLDAQRLTPASVEGIIGDKPNVLFSILGRLGGAQIGRIAARHTGGGTVQTPGILSAQMQRLLEAGVSNPAKRMLTDSIQDESLFKALLMPMDTPEAERLVRTRLNAWVIGVLNEQQDVEE